MGGLVALVSGEGISRVLSFLAIALLTRRMGDSAWAPVAVALTVLQFGSLLVELGMRLFGAREVAKHPADAAGLMSPILSTQLAVAAAMVLLALSVSVFHLMDADVARLLPGYAVSLLAFPFMMPWVFQGLGVMRWVAIPQVTRYAVLLLLVVLLVHSAAQAPLLPWLEAAAVAAAGGMAVFGLRRFGVHVAVSPRTAFDRHVLREALPISASQIVWVVRMYLPTLALWYLVPRASVAHFDVAHRVYMVLQAILTVYLMNLYTPLSRAVHGPRRHMLGLLAGSTALATFGAVVGAFLLSARPGALLGVLNGAAFNTAEGAITLTIFAFTLPVLVLRGHCYFALVALGQQRRELACSVGACLALVVMLYVWVPGGGVRGAAMSMLVGEAVGLLLSLVVLVAAVRRHQAVGDGSEAVALT